MTPLQPRPLTYVGELALCTQGHGQRRGGRQLRLAIGFGQPTDGMGVSPVLGLLLGWKLVPVKEAAELSSAPAAPVCGA